MLQSPAMMRITATAVVSAALATLALGGACGGDGDDAPGELFPTKPECEGEAIVAYAGSSPQVISKLAIGAQADGFDLDGDGKPDNKLAAAAGLAQSAIAEALAAYEIVIPLEMFDLPAAAPDACVKFAIYLGAVKQDADGDGAVSHVAGGDCDDTDPAVRPGAAEIPLNFVDDNCNGRTDEVGDVQSADTEDRDLDQVTIAAGDCNDLDPAVHPGAVELCGDGLDNDCDRVADRSGGATATACNPFDPAAPQDIPLDPLSFVEGAPAIAFRDGVVVQRDGALVLTAGPSIFAVNIPVTAGISLDLVITGAQIEGNLVEEGGAIVIKNGRLGGVIDARTADTIRGLELAEIGLSPEDSLLDATFANLLGPLLALPKAAAAVSGKYINCRTPDIDVDRDGLEAYCDSDVDADPKTVDVCVDGDGTEVTDVLGSDGVPVMNCTEALKGAKPRFVDGISVELNFETSAVKSLTPPS